MDALYPCLLALFLAHELDAVACREWRLLYVLRGMPEAKARAWFIALHIPLVAALTWSSASAHPAAEAVRLGLALFAIVHAALHYRLRRAPAYEFHSPLSIGLIAGAAIVGAVYAALVLEAGRGTAARVPQGACTGSRTRAVTPSIIDGSASHAERRLTCPDMTNPVSHFEIPVTDLDRAVRFYEVVLGTTLEKRTIDGYDMAFFPRADGRPGASGALATGDVYVPTKSGAIVYFDVPDIDAALDRARQLGSHVLYGKKDIGEAGYVAEVEDSEGNRLALSQPPHETP
jgi:uncharacterized protein